MGMREVAAGAAWLDENFPGWERKIDLGTLNIASCSNCILGQSLRELAEAEDRTTDGYAYGFRLYDRQLDQGLITEDQLWLLDRAFEANRDNEVIWRELIKERFNTGNLSDDR